MAQRRMFSLKVIDTDTFLDMSASAQNLYFHLGMRADDDGFVASPKKIMVMANASEDDMKVLIAKNFIIRMATNGVSVITHWHTNNLIRPDRYQETEYKEEKSRLDVVNGKYSQSFGMTSGIPDVIPSIGKDRLGKDTIATKVALVTNSTIKKETASKGKKKPTFTSMEQLTGEKVQRHLRIIGYFFQRKGLVFTTPEALSEAVKRWLRVATGVAKFDEDNVNKAFEQAEQWPEWQLETVYKKLTGQNL
jgi:hypothetical protein